MCLTVCSSWRSAAGVASIFAFLLLFAPSSSAHLDLLYPEPRELGSDRRSTNSNLKQGPCGQDRRNERTQTVSVFRPGETITVAWNEYVNHTSYYRIAFDVDGDDSFPVFAGRFVSEKDDDPALLCPVDGHVILAYEFDDRVRGDHSLEITLPNVECENCTLQVIQFMYGSSRPYYFQCADLALRPGGADAGIPVPNERDSGLETDEFQAASACWTDLNAPAVSATLPPPAEPVAAPNNAAEGTAPSDSVRTSSSPSGCSSTGSSRSPLPQNSFLAGCVLFVLASVLRRRQ